MANYVEFRKGQVQNLFIYLYGQRHYIYCKDYITIIMFGESHMYVCRQFVQSY